MHPYRMDVEGQNVCCDSMLNSRDSFVLKIDGNEKKSKGVKILMKSRETLLLCMLT